MEMVLNARLVVCALSDIGMGPEYPQRRLARASSLTAQEKLKVVVFAWD
jgi:hypothetical protein